MREHKYQAWHKKEQKMYIPNYLHFSPEGELFGVLVNEGQLLSIDDFELREYTGFRDYKGQEIYEGDIIRIDEGCVGTIVYRSACFYYEDKYDGPLMIEDLGSDLIVLGNVYQHNHLLPEDSDN